MSDDDDLEAELFNPVTAGIFNVDWLRDRETGIWRSPVPTEHERDEFRAQHLSMTDAAGAATFDQAYPMLWRWSVSPASAYQPSWSCSTWARSLTIHY